MEGYFCVKKSFFQDIFVKSLIKFKLPGRHVPLLGKFFKVEKPEKKKETFNFKFKLLRFVTEKKLYMKHLFETLGVSDYKIFYFILRYYDIQLFIF